MRHPVYLPNGRIDPAIHAPSPKPLTHEEAIKPNAKPKVQK